MWAMYDSVDVATVPAHANAVAGYVGGSWPTYAALVRRFPHAEHLSIAVNAGEEAECLDCEAGDATPAQVPEWVRHQLARGVAKPAVYCSLSVVVEVLNELTRAGIKRSQIRLWTAHYTYTPHICGPHDGCSTNADATQWTDRALGRNLDESLCSDSFFHAVKVDPLAPLTDSERRLANTLESYLRHPHAHPHGLRVTRAALEQARKEVWLAAVKGRLADGRHVPAGWSVRSRAERYRLLWGLSGR